MNIFVDSYVNYEGFGYKLVEVIWNKSLTSL